MDAGERRGGAPTGGDAESELAGRPSWLLLDKPVPLRATWASSFPDHLRLTKRWEAFPLALELSADYDVAVQALSARASVKDSIVGGTLRLNTATSEVMYSRRFELQDGLALNISGAADYQGRQPPRLGVHVEVRQGAALLTGSWWRFERRVRVKGPVSLQLAGGLKVPTPSARYTLGGDAGGADGGAARGLSMGEFHLAVTGVDVLLEV